MWIFFKTSDSAFAHCYSMSRLQVAPQRANTSETRKLNQKLEVGLGHVPKNIVMKEENGVCACERYSDGIYKLNSISARFSADVTLAKYSGSSFCISSSDRVSCSSASENLSRTKFETEAGFV